MDVAFAVTSNGWKTLTDEYKILNSIKQKAVDDFLNLAKNTVADPTDGVAAYFEGINNECERFFDLLQCVKPSEYHIIFLANDGSSYVYGAWVNNPHNVRLKHKISCDFYNPQPMTPAKSNSHGPINDHTCTCGNTRCNKNEKSCWLCGAPINK